MKKLMTIAEAMKRPNDNEFYYRALQEWVAKDPQTRGQKKLGELTSCEFSEILLEAQRLKEVS
jgi:hypothetical protein